jgi:hypothetical protein
MGIAVFQIVDVAVFRFEAFRHLFHLLTIHLPIRQIYQIVEGKLA